ncbi:MAG: glycerophosphodiester phosphodiesterase family protein [Steroidobacteraceae bacterium]
MTPEIVAHRGDAEHFPENSLPGLESAWRHGLRYVEFDVQLSADGVPYVVHDASLERTTSAAGDLRFLNSGQLDGIDASEPTRFGGRHAGTRLPRLAAAAGLMAEIPGAQAFVELKRASLVHHGRAHCIERVLTALRDVIDRSVVISFDAEACRLVRAACDVPIGWVLDAEPGSRLAALEDLRPQYLFCDHRLLAGGAPLPGGPWTWVVYEVTDAGLALELKSRGVAMVESMTPLRLARELQDSALMLPA